MSPNGKTHNEIDHILIEGQRHSSILDVQSFRAADCDTDHHRAVANIGEILAVNKQDGINFVWRGSISEVKRSRG
jgi:hypothetical protein